MAILAFASVAAAEEPTAVTQDELLARVRATDPRLAALDARRSAARAEPRAARIWTNPTLSWRREEVSASGETATDDFLELSLPLDVSGRRAHRAAALDAGADVVAADAVGERLEIELAALAAYRDAASARERTRILQDGRDALARATQNVRKRREAGDSSGYELGRLEIELATFEDLLAESRTELGVARRALARAAGMPAGLLDAATNLTPPPAPPSPESLVSEATAKRGHRLAALARVRREEESSIVAGRAWIPALELAGGSKTAKAAGVTASGFTAGLGLTLPLFDRGQADRARADARAREAKAALEAVDRQIRGEVEDASARLADRLARSTRFETAQLPRLEQLVRQAETSYREGEITVFELVDAHRTARDTHLRTLDLSLQASRAELELWRALGRNP
jgi:cobalt-zinc-cadmium efflux system outer membrane protein